MSDPNSFAWHQRIKAAFPLSYESVLKKTFKHQVRQLQIFDSLIESGHQVSSYFVDSLAFDDKSGLSNSWRLPPARLQIPWQKDLLVIVESNNVKLFDMSTASVVATLELAKSDAFQISYHVYTDVKGNNNSRNILLTENKVY